MPFPDGCSCPALPLHADFRSLLSTLPQPHKCGTYTTAARRKSQRLAAMAGPPAARRFRLPRVTPRTPPHSPPAVGSGCRCPCSRHTQSPCGGGRGPAGRLRRRALAGAAAAAAPALAALRPQTQPHALALLGGRVVIEGRDVGQARPHHRRQLAHLVRPGSGGGRAGGRAEVGRGSGAAQRSRTGRQHACSAPPPSDQNNAAPHMHLVWHARFVKKLLLLEPQPPADAQGWAQRALACGPRGASGCMLRALRAPGCQAHMPAGPSGAHCR